MEDINIVGKRAKEKIFFFFFFDQNKRKKKDELMTHHQWGKGLKRRYVNCW